MMTLKFRIASSDRIKVYTVVGRLDGDGESDWQCQCLGYSYRRRCRHILAAMQAIDSGIQKVEVLQEKQDD
tara:strand:- start:126 stop:338 length:213 start_codon:yes stop_codon:yes gene_type:complete